MSLKKREIDHLTSWANRNNTSVDVDQIEKIECYLQLIKSWSRRINLVSPNDLNVLLERHFIDSLTPIQEITAGAFILDVGSGGGFPGIPIAIMRIDTKMHLLESIHKKTLFLAKAKEVLGLDNIIVIEKRLEEFSSETKYDIATMRALPHWERAIGVIRPLLKPDGKIIYYEKIGLYKLL